MAVHFLLQLKLAMTLELACLQSLLSTPIFVIIFDLYDHCTSSLGLSAASALQHKRGTERLSKEYGLSYHVIPGLKGS